MSEDVVVMSRNLPPRGQGQAKGLQVRPRKETERGVGGRHDWWKEADRAEELRESKDFSKKAQAKSLGGTLFQIAQYPSAPSAPRVPELPCLPGFPTGPCNDGKESTGQASQLGKFTPKVWVVLAPAITSVVRRIAGEQGLHTGVANSTC